MAKRLSVVARRSTGEDRQQREQTHLHEDVVPAAPVLAAVQLVPQRAVEPRQPDQPEHHRELEDGASGDVGCEVVGRAPDQDHVDEVVEQLEETDLAFGDDLAMASRWRAKPGPHSVSNPLAADLTHQRGGRRTRRVSGGRLITVVRHRHGHIFASGVGICERVATAAERSGGARCDRSTADVADGAAAERRGGDRVEVHRFGEDPLSRSEDDGMHEEANLVDQALRDAIEPTGRPTMTAGAGRAVGGDALLAVRVQLRSGERGFESEPSRRRARPSDARRSCDSGRRRCTQRSPRHGRPRRSSPRTRCRRRRAPSDAKRTLIERTPRSARANTARSLSIRLPARKRLTHVGLGGQHARLETGHTGRDCERPSGIAERLAAATRSPPGPMYSRREVSVKATIVAERRGERHRRRPRSVPALRCLPSSPRTTSEPRLDGLSSSVRPRQADDLVACLDQLGDDR